MTSPGGTSGESLPTEKRAYVGKMRSWQANVSVAASGPAFASGVKAFEDIGMYPKVAAQLRYTSADIAYLSSHWRGPEYKVPHEWHAAAYECDHASVMQHLSRAKEFLVQGSQDSNFDGGSLLFAYSGHGREGDGTLFLNDDTFFSADDLVDKCLEIRRSAPGRGRLRLSLLLDSCHSGAFLLRVLERVLFDEADKLVPDYFLASSMADEYSYELPVLGHGLSTFCFSVKPNTFESMVASADGMPVTWAVAAGARGCSIVSCGEQNPVVYDAYELRVANQPVRLWIDEDTDVLRPRAEWEADLVAARDDVRAVLGRLGGLRFELRPA